MASEMIERTELLAAIALRAGALRQLGRTLAAGEDDPAWVRLHARIGELEWLSGMVVRWGLESVVVKGEGDGE